MVEKDKSNQHQKYERIYTMKKHWEAIYQILGWLSWLDPIIDPDGTNLLMFYFLMFPLKRKAIQARFRKTMAEDRQSYLRISDDGLEYINWQLLKMRCKWDDIKRIKKSPLLGDILYLERIEEINPEFTKFIGKPQIPLSALAGWPNGGLEEDLRKFAPQLFDHQG